MTAFKVSYAPDVIATFEPMKSLVWVHSKMIPIFLTNKYESRCFSLVPSVMNISNTKNLYMSNFNNC